MDRKYDALDWQSFSQKKDIEEIVKNTRDKKDIEITATIEIAMLVSSIIAPKLFEENVPIIVWVIIAIVTVIPLLWLAAKFGMSFYKKRRLGNDIPDVSLMLDLFDNDICYYALMAESYAEKIKMVEGENISNVEQFYFIETCFYVNKAIYNLSLTQACVDKMYSTNSKTLYSSRKISYTRLKNIFNILDESIEIVKGKFDMISEIDMDNNYSKLFELYLESYDRFKALFFDIDTPLRESYREIGNSRE